jgi:murein DD-endopeptidase MepM/ murein hydrolase activator NlpD
VGYRLAPRAAEDQIVRTFFALVVFALFSAAATYTIKPGDTLGSIAKHNGVSVAALASANHLTDPNRIYAGQQLVIPGAKPGPAPARYVVRSGDTLGRIARAHHTSVAALVKANGIKNPNRLRVGQELVIPGAGGGATWVCPVAGRTRFIDDFGAPRSGGRHHEGIDILAPRGTPVVATVSGVVVRHDQPRGGLAFYLRGDDGLTYYGAHLATFVRGDGRVRIGQTIGTVGDSGNARGGPTHLHFEVINHAGAKDPFALLTRACPKA